MKKFVVFLFVAALNFIVPAFCQTIDSLSLPTVYIQPGVNARIPVNLTNNSFPVGGFSLKLISSDSLNVEFISCDRGRDIEQFSFFHVNRSRGIINVIGIANLPSYNPISPLHMGPHEICILNVRTSPDAVEGTYIDIEFCSSNDSINYITDSTGYSLLEPTTLDGTVIIGVQSVLDESSLVPLSFELKGNYPNPFNASTIIEYSLAEQGYVSLEIFDILGRKVTTLVDGFEQAGNYQKAWYGRNDMGQVLSSGIYFCKLAVDGRIVTKSLNFLK